MFNASLEERSESAISKINIYNPDLVSRTGVNMKLLPALVITGLFSITGWMFFNIWAYFGTLIVGLIMAIVVTRQPLKANSLLYPYAAMEGFVVGGFTKLILQFYEVGYEVPLAAILLTASIFIACYTAYSVGYIQYNQNFIRMVGVAVLAAVLFYAAAILTGIFGNSALLDFYLGTGLLSILLSLVMVGVAIATLVADFMFLRKAEHIYPKEMEAFLAFGILASLVWIYIEMLRLLAKLVSRD